MVAFYLLDCVFCFGLGVIYSHQSDVAVDVSDSKVSVRCFESDCEFVCVGDECLAILQREACHVSELLCGGVNEVVHLIVCLLFFDVSKIRKFFRYANFFEVFFLWHKKSGPAMEPPKTNNLLK